MSGLEEFLDSKRIHQIVCLREDEPDSDGRIESDIRMPDGSPLYYQQGEYEEHLAHVAKLLTKHEHYQLVFCPKLRNIDYDLIMRNEEEVLIERTRAPRVLFQILESNLVSVLVDYLNMEFIPHRYERQGTIQVLKKMQKDLAK